MGVDWQSELNEPGVPKMDKSNPYQSPRTDAAIPVADPPVKQKTGQLRKDKYPTSSLLSGVAVLQLLVALFIWSIHGSTFGWIDWAFSLDFLVFVGLAIFARWLPAIAGIIGFLLYASYLGTQATVSLEVLRSGWIFKLPVAVLLTIALVCGFVERRNDTRKSESGE